MLRVKKAALFFGLLLAAALFTACSRNYPPPFDYSGLKEIQKGDLVSEKTDTTAKEPQETAAAEQSENPKQDTAVKENTESEEITDKVIATEPPQEENKGSGNNNDTSYKEDEKLRKYFTEEEISYLHDCAFLGDSTCLGYGRYGFIGESRVFGNGGVAARNIHTHTFTQKGKEVDFITAMKNTGCSNFYFMMGMNDVRIVSAEDYKKFYRELLAEIGAKCPDAKIHILSVTPITEDCDFYPNENITLLNVKLAELAAEEGYAFVDTAAAVRNEKGYLKDELNGGDGIHMKGEAYIEMLRVILKDAFG